MRRRRDPRYRYVLVYLLAVAGAIIWVAMVIDSIARDTDPCGRTGPPDMMQVPATCTRP